MTTEELTRLMRLRTQIKTLDLAALRQRSGLSLGEIASTAGVSPTTIMRWEQGLHKPHGIQAVRYAVIVDAMLAAENDQVLTGPAA